MEDTILATAKVLHPPDEDGVSQEAGTGMKASLLTLRLLKWWCVWKAKKEEEGKVQKEKSGAPGALPLPGLNPLTAGPGARGEQRARERRLRAAFNWARKRWKSFNSFVARRKSRRLWEEVLASVRSGPGPVKVQNWPGPTMSRFSPQAKKVALAQSRILTQSSVSKRFLLSDAVSSMMDVKAQGSRPHTGFARSVQYRQALKVLAWDEYVVSHWLQVTAGIRVATVGAGTLFLGYKWVSEGNAAVDGVRKWIRDVAQAPVPRAKWLSYFSHDER